MKKLFVFLMTFYTVTMVNASWFWRSDSSRKHEPKKSERSVFDSDLPASPNFEREARLEQKFEKLMDEWGSLQLDEIPDKYQLKPEEILVLLRSNNPEFLERTVWLYDQPFTVRQLLGELSHQTAEYTPDVLTTITENYYVKKTAEQYQAFKDEALMRARVALLNALRSIADYTSRTAQEMEENLREEIE